jgi:DNA-binding IclR family transcriptional regulator
MPKRVLSSISGVLRVLRQFALVQDTWGPRELSRAIGLSKSSTMRILQTMAEDNFLINEERINKYVIGPELWRLGLGLKNRTTLSRITVPILEKYVREINETLHFFRYDQGAVIFDEIVECTHAVRFHVDPGIPYEMGKGAAGKVILAFLPASVTQEILKKLEGNPNASVDELSKKISETKHKGYSFTINERGSGVIAFAAPVFGPDNDLLGGVGLAVPAMRYRPEDHGRYANVVRSCAAEISFVARPNEDELKKNDEKGEDY